MVQCSPIWIHVVLFSYNIYMFTRKAHTCRIWISVCVHTSRPYVLSNHLQQQSTRIALGGKAPTDDGQTSQIYIVESIKSEIPGTKRQLSYKYMQVQCSSNFYLAIPALSVHISIYRPKLARHADINTPCGS